MLARMRSVLHGDEGATMVEYAFMLMLIAAVCIATVSQIGSTVKAYYVAANGGFP